MKEICRFMDYNIGQLYPKRQMFFMFHQIPLRNNVLVIFFYALLALTLMVLIEFFQSNRITWKRQFEINMQDCNSRKTQLHFWNGANIWAKCVWIPYTQHYYDCKYIVASTGIEIIKTFIYGSQIIHYLQFNHVISKNFHNYCKITKLDWKKQTFTHRLCNTTTNYYDNGLNIWITFSANDL